MNNSFSRGHRRQTVAHKGRRKIEVAHCLRADDVIAVVRPGGVRRVDWRHRVCELDSSVTARIDAARKTSATPAPVQTRRCFST